MLARFATVSGFLVLLLIILFVLLLHYYFLNNNFYQISQQNVSLKIKNYKSSIFNCTAIFGGKLAEIRKAERFMKLETLQSSAQPLEHSLSHQGLLYCPETNVFPIAYSILTYKNFQQLLQLFRVLYRPWNYYCIHLDRKSTGSFKSSVKLFAKAYANVKLSKKEISVTWGNISVLYAALSCLEELSKFDWKYLLNIAGTDFPLKTNKEIVEYLQNLGGLSDVQDLPQTEHWKYKYSFKDGATYDKLLRVKESLRNGTYPYRKGPPPHNLTVHKGSFSAALSKDFVDFILNSKISKDLLVWLQDTFIPDEFYWSTLYHDYFLPRKALSIGKPANQEFRVRYTHWGGRSPSCSGYYEHGLCVFGVGDLKWLFKRPEIFAHKFDKKMQPTTMDCLEDILIEKSLSTCL